MMLRRSSALAALLPLVLASLGCFDALGLDGLRFEPPSQGSVVAASSSGSGGSGGSDGSGGSSTAGAGGAGGTGGSGGAAPTNLCVGAPAPTSDSFSTGVNSEWQNVYASPDKQALFHPSLEGRVQFRVKKSAWYHDDTAPFYFQCVSGDFAAHAKISNCDLVDHTWCYNGDISAEFYGGGILVRDPNSDLNLSDQAWIMLNIGSQDDPPHSKPGIWATTASMTKHPPDYGDITNNPETNMPDIQAYLLVCRVAGQFAFFARSPINSLNYAPVSFSYQNDITLPDVVQVGFTAHAYEAPASGPNSVHAIEVEFFAFGVGATAPTSLDLQTCLAAAPEI